MMRGLAVVLLVAVASLVAGRSGAEESATFEGTLRPLTEPIFLRYRPVPAFTATVRVVDSWLGPKSTSLLVEGRISQAGALLDWQLNARFSGDSAEVQAERAPVLVTARSSERGDWTVAEAMGKHPVSGAELTPGTPEHSEMLVAVLGQFPPLPDQPWDQGSNFGPALEENFKRTHAAESKFDVWADFSAPVLGETVLNARRGLVAKIGGTIVARANGGKSETYIAGYVVYDAETGIIAKSVLRSNAPMGGSRSMEWRVVTTVTETAFP